MVLLGRTLSKVAKVAKEIGSLATAIECDVGSPESVAAAFGEIGKMGTSIDVLINNAAVYEPFFVEDARTDQLRGAVEANLLGPMVVCKEAIPAMRPGSHIINISSESVAMDYPMLSLYQSTKAGLERFSASLGKELASRGIRVTVVRAGAMFDEDSKAPNWDPEAAARFHELCTSAGIDLRARASSHFRSAATIVSGLLDLPADINVPFVQLEGFRA